MNQERVRLRAQARREKLFCEIRSPIKRRIFDYLKSRGADGASTQEILDFVYMHDSDGGPASNCISAHVRQMNIVLRERGMRIVSTMGRFATYHIVDNPHGS